MKKYFVFSDVHGEYHKLQCALNEAGFDIANPDHVIISDGDLFDRGPQSKECLDFIVNLLNKGRAFVVMGNHDLRLWELLFEPYKTTGFDKYDVCNGVGKTMNSFLGINIEDKNWNGAVFQAMRNSGLPQKVASDLYLYFFNANWCLENDKYVITHGWIPTFNEVRKLGTTHYEPNGKLLRDWRTAATRKDWSRAVWVDTEKILVAQHNKTAKYYSQKEAAKTFIIGHFWANKLVLAYNPTVQFEYFTLQDKSGAISPTLQAENIIAIDGMSNYYSSGDPTAIGQLEGKVNVFTFSSSEIFSTIPIFS